MTFKLVPSGGPGPGTEWDYCTSNLGVPEQINVQVADPGSVVVSFVTFEVRCVLLAIVQTRKSSPCLRKQCATGGWFQAQAPTNPPIVTIEGSDIHGVTHVHRTAGGRL